MPRKRRKTPDTRRLAVSTAVALPATVPKRWVKLVVGVFLLAPAAVLTQTFFTAFARATIQGEFWRTEEFWFFSMGAILWTIAFFGLPRPLWLYVFGHELTHALGVWLMGGRVHGFRVSREGGHVLADRTNTWIALAPYFIPIYSVVAVAIYGLAGIFVDVTPWRTWLYAVLGITWAFHLTFTCWMIPKGQPDLHYGGTLFSLVLIYLMNLLLLSGLLVLASPQVTLLGFARDALENAMNMTVALTMAINHLLR